MHMCMTLPGYLAGICDYMSLYVLHKPNPPWIVLDACTPKYYDLVVPIIDVLDNGGYTVIIGTINDSEVLSTSQES